MIDETGFRDGRHRRAEARGAAAAGDRSLQRALDLLGHAGDGDRGGVTRQMTVEVRSFWGVEDDGTADTQQRAEWRYLEAFWNGDVFAYTGHSHFGHGPLEPTNYGARQLPRPLPGDAGELVPVVQLLRRRLPRDAPGRVAQPRGRDERAARVLERHGRVDREVSDRAPRRQRQELVAAARRDAHRRAVGRARLRADARRQRRARQRVRSGKTPITVAY